MTDSEGTFQALKAALATGGVNSAMETLADQLRTEGRYQELFEALKMRSHGVLLVVPKDVVCL